MNLKTKLGAGILILIAIGAIYIFSRSSSTSVVTTPRIQETPKTPVTTIPTPPATKTYSMADVASHKNAQSCWTAIRGNVYDLTSWINQHPGGAQAILSLCGTDGTNTFVSQHGGQARPEAELKTFFIGTFK